MKADLSGEVALITGSAGSIGSGTAKILARNGAIVYLNDINRDAGTSLRKQIVESGGEAYFVPGSVTNDAEMRAFVQSALDGYGKVDILINNAGVNVGKEGRRPAGEYREDDWNRVIDICMDGFYSCLKYVLPGMIERKTGRVVNIGSVAGWRAPLRNQSPYSAAKAAIVNLTRTMAIEYGKYNITVNAVIPGSIMNEQLKTAVYGTPEMTESMLSHIPLGKIGAPEDIGNTILFLVSEEAEYITGCSINVDGGWASGYACST
jgi:3-oxoacyl-[acyl-carrier protein] reductase